MALLIQYLFILYNKKMGALSTITQFQRRLTFRGISHKWLVCTHRWRQLAWKWVPALTGERVREGRSGPSRRTRVRMGKQWRSEQVIHLASGESSEIPVIGLTGLSHRSLYDKLIEQVSANICMTWVYFSFKFSCPQALLLIKAVPSLAICLNPLILRKSQSLGHGPA